MEKHCETRKNIYVPPLRKPGMAPLPHLSWQAQIPISRSLDNIKGMATSMEKEEDKAKKKT